jgi:hypothetical protein
LKEGEIVMIDKEGVGGGQEAKVGDATSDV